MQLSLGLSALVSTALLLSGASAATWKVNVGENSLLTFSPNNTVAAVGDIVEFHFFGHNHSVVQGGFTTPCQTGSVTNGFSSGFIPVTGTGEAPQVFQVTVGVKTPIWFYCPQTIPGNHCKAGMVGSINAPATGNTLAAFAAGATAFNGTNNFPPTVGQGGVFAPNSDASSSSSSSSTSTATTTAPFGAKNTTTTTGSSSSSVHTTTVVTSVSGAGSKTSGPSSGASSTAAPSPISGAMSSQEVGLGKVAGLLLMGVAALIFM